MLRFLASSFVFLVSGLAVEAAEATGDTVGRVRVTAVPDSMGRGSSNPRARYGAMVLEVYGPEPNPILNDVRTIYAMNDGGRWDFKLAGKSFLCDYEGSRAHIHFSMKGKLAETK